MCVCVRVRVCMCRCVCVCVCVHTPVYVVSSVQFESGGSLNFFSTVGKYPPIIMWRPIFKANEADFSSYIGGTHSCGSMSEGEIDALADTLAALATARDWAAACAAAENLAGRRLSLGSWRLVLCSAVVECIEAAEAGGVWLGTSVSTAELLSSPSLADLDAAEHSGWSRLAVANMRLLAGWFVLVVSYQRQYPSARVSVPTSSLISRGVAAALKLAQRGLRLPTSLPAPRTANFVTAPPASGTSTSQPHAPQGDTTNHRYDPPSEPALSARTSPIAGGAQVVAAALAALGAGLELMDAKTCSAAENATLTALEPPRLPGTASAHEHAQESNTIWPHPLPEDTIKDLLSAWIQFVIHSAGSRVGADGTPTTAPEGDWDRVRRLTLGLLALCNEDEEHMRTHMLTQEAVTNNTAAAVAKVELAHNATKISQSAGLYQHTHLLTNSIQSAVVTGPLNRRGKLPSRLHTHTQTHTHTHIHTHTHSHTHKDTRTLMSHAQTIHALVSHLSMSVSEHVLCVSRARTLTHPHTHTTHAHAHTPHTRTRTHVRTHTRTHTYTHTRTHTHTHAHAHENKSFHTLESIM